VLHVRVVVPSPTSPTVLDALVAFDAVCNVVWLAGASVNPVGDLIQFDVPPEAANGVLAALRARGVEVDGSISVERTDMTLSAAADRARAAAPGHSSEAVIWADVEARVADDSAMTGTYVLLLTLAVMIGAVGILTDSPILIIGAMVLGPEYGPLSGIALGLHRRRWDLVTGALRTLAIGFVIGMAATLLFALGVQAIGRTPEAYSAGTRPLTQFISHPDFWSVVVAVLAGVAGTVTLTQGKAGALVGVLISVTTIPAASNVSIAIAHGRGNEAWGALAQLALNLVVIVVVGALTLAVEHAVVDRKRAPG
jgi:uncharacterized hydrophobic protein (TIGR00271 family)